MFLCQPLLDVLIGRGIEDIDSFTQVPSWNDLPDPKSIPRILRGGSARGLLPRRPGHRDCGRPDPFGGCASDRSSRPRVLSPKSGR
jgi:hypothetical protein